MTDNKQAVPNPDEKICAQCKRKFNSFGRELYCLDCADKRAKKRNQLDAQKRKTDRKLEKKLGTTLPTSPVSGWEELLLDDLSNPFNDATELELCRQYGVPAVEFYAFKSKHPDFMGELNRRSEKYSSQESIYYKKMLVKQAKTNPTAVLVGLKLTKQYNEKALSEDPLAGLSEEDRWKELQQLLSKVAKP